MLEPAQSPTMRWLLLPALLFACAMSCSPPLRSEFEGESEGAIDGQGAYWGTQRIGANYFNEVPTAEWFSAASEAGIKLVRLAYGKWEGAERDFLIGNADSYEGLVEKDLAVLIRKLDIAQDHGMSVVLAPLSLPGARFRQFNGGRRDGRLWTDEVYLEQAVQFWRDLADRMKDHPAVVGYDLLNEPHPEWFHGKRDFWDRGFMEWYSTVEGGPGDLNRFHRTVAASIRDVDSETPIIVETGLYGTPWAIEYLRPVEVDNVIYSFHMYEPYAYTTKRINQGRVKYPGTVEIEALSKPWRFDVAAINEFFDPVRRWAETNGIPPSRIFVGEFGCDRSVQGAADYLRDLVRIFNEEGWHWAFYTFRPDSWPNLDYELGTDRPGERYWELAERGLLRESYDELYNQRRDNPVWSVLSTEFENRRRAGNGGEELTTESTEGGSAQGRELRIRN